LGTLVVGILLLICTTEFSTCLNIVLRDKGLEEEEELVLWEVLEFICCCCATAVDGIVIIIIATANMMAVTSNRFLIGGNLRIVHQIYSYAWNIRIHHSRSNSTAGIQAEYGAKFSRNTVVIIILYRHDTGIRMTP
jgi:hypothetical protein